MIRVKLPFGGHHARAAGSVRRRGREVRAAEQGPRHHAPEHPDAPHPAARSREGDPRARRLRALQPRGLRQHDAQRHRRPVGGRGQGRAVRPDPLRGRLRALLRAPPHHARRCRARSRPPSTAAPSDRAISGIHDVAFRARVREIDGRGEVRGAEMLVGGGTSIMPRVAQVLYDFVELDDGEYLKVTEAVMRIFDRQEWLRDEPRPRAHQGVRRQVRHRRAAQPGRGGAAGRLGRRTRLLDRAAAVPRRRARDRAGAAGGLRHAPTATCREFERFRSTNVREQKQEGFVTVEAKITRGDLTPEQFRGLAAIMRDYAGGYARTTVQQNLVLRWVREESVYDVWRALSELGLGDAGLARGRRRRLLPGNGLAASSGSRARWGSTRPSRSGSRRWRSMTS